MSKNKKVKTPFTGVDLSGINTSMELDSGQELARLYDGDLCATLKVVGDVVVIYKDEIYKAPSQFPEDLMKLFHEGKADSKHGVEIAFNNWFEIFVWKVVKDNKSNEKLDFAGLCDVVDAEGNTLDEIRGLLSDCIKECRAAIAEQEAENAERQLFVVTETVQDYKGAGTYVFGASRDLATASGILRDAIKEHFGCEDRFADEQDPQKAMDTFIDGHFTNPEKTGWRYFDGDTDYTFEIHKTKLS